MATKSVQIAADAGKVQLPNGLVYDAGDVVTLTEDQFAEINASLIPGTVIDLSGEVSLLSSVSPGLYVYRFFIDLANDADSTGDLDTFTPGFPGSVVHTRFVVNTPVVTASDEIDLNLEIGTTNLTGGVVNITSAAATPKGAVINGSAVSGNNVFDSDDVLTLENVVTAAFAEGDGYFEAILAAS